MKNLKDKILFGSIGALIILLMLSQCNSKRMQQELYEQLTAANKEVIRLDTLKKEADGQYAKLVDYYQTEKDLREEISSKNKDLGKLIKEKDERILMLNNTVVSLESQINSGEVAVNESDSTVIDLHLRYPNEDPAFINWRGSIFTSTQRYSGEWTFGRLPIQVILTETDRGLWNSRLVGPDWLRVDSIEVKSLPPQEIVKPEKDNFGLYVGGGYLSSLQNNQSNGVTIGFGAQYKNSTLMLNYGSISDFIGISYYHRIKLNKP